MRDTLQPVFGKHGTYYVHPTAVVEDGAQIGEGTKIWHFAHVRPSASIGRFCNIGKGVYVEGVVGNYCKLQNNVNIYHGVRLEDYVFMGPNSTTTNDLYPDATKPEWTCVPTTIKTGAAIGAGSVVVCGIVIGHNALIGAGSAVRTNVPANEIWAGNPAKRLRKKPKGA